MMTHPRPGEHGKPVTIKSPHTPTPLTTWSDPCAIATVVPDGAMPPVVNGVRIDRPDLPSPDRANWEQLARAIDFEEPPFETGGMKPAAGAVVVEPDGRLWLVSPTNGFGHYMNTFPKGKTDGMSLKATALKEVFEEAGLMVDLFAHLIDVTKSTSRTRYYLARRKGGNPADMCWEDQAVHLVPLEKAKEMLNQKVDHQVIDALTEQWNNWAASVLMGTQSVMFPERTLKSFQYVPRPLGSGTPGLFDVFPSLDEAVEEAVEEEDGHPNDEGMSPEDLEELQIAFGLEPLNPKPPEGGPKPSEPAPSKMGRPITLPGPIGALAKKAGGVGLLAEELGVTPRTVRRWATGGTIPLLPLKMLGLLFEKHHVDPSGLQE